MGCVDLGVETQAVLHEIEKLEVAENQKDIEGMLALATEGFLVAFGNRVLEGQDAARAWLREAVKGYVSSRHTPLHVEVSPCGTMAWVLAREQNRREKQGSIAETEQVYLLAFKKIEGVWKQTAVCIS